MGNLTVYEYQTATKALATIKAHSQVLASAVFQLLDLFKSLDERNEKWANPYTDVQISLGELFTDATTKWEPLIETHKPLNMPPLKATPIGRRI